MVAQDIKNAFLDACEFLWVDPATVTLETINRARIEANTSLIKYLRSGNQAAFDQAAADIDNAASVLKLHLPAMADWQRAAQVKTKTEKDAKTSATNTALIIASCRMAAGTRAVSASGAQSLITSKVQALKIISGLYAEDAKVISGSINHVLRLIEDVHQIVAERPVFQTSVMDTIRNAREWMNASRYGDRIVETIAAAVANGKAELEKGWDAGLKDEGILAKLKPLVPPEAVETIPGAQQFGPPRLVWSR